MVSCIILYERLRMGLFVFTRLITPNQEILQHTKIMVMKYFPNKYRKAYVISDSYGMENPLASLFEKAGRKAEGE